MPGNAIVADSATSSVYASLHHPLIAAWYLLPVCACAAVLWTEIAWAAWLVPFMWFVIVPLADRLVGRVSAHTTDATDAAVYGPQFGVALLVVPAGYVTLALVSACVVLRTLPPGTVIGLGLTLGIVMSQMLLASRLFAARESRVTRWLSRLATGIVGLGHYRDLESHAHHQTCATPADPLSARFGENLYKFAWRATTRSTALSGRAGAHAGEALVTAAVAVIGYGIVAVAGGMDAFAMLAIAWSSALLLHLTVLYAQHYGLLRLKRQDGAFVRPGPTDAWQDRYRVSNALLLNAPRHVDAHAHPARPFSGMTVYSAAPDLDLSYPLVSLLALVPALWFRRMNPRVARWADGDLHRTNIDGDAYMMLMARYHRPRANH